MLERLGRDRLRPRPSGRAVVWLVAAIALVSIGTGVAAIVTEPTLGTTGTLGELQAVAEFSGTVVGFALLVTAWGMRRGYRLAYVAAAVLVFLSAAHGVVQSRLLSVPLVVVSVGGLVVLVFTSERFTRSSSLTLDATQLGALIAIVGVFCYGTAGAYALRAEFTGVETVVDAVYFTLVTASTVGYGDVHPTNDGARLFAISLVILGPATVAVAVGSLFGPAIDRRLSRTGSRVADRPTDRAARVVVLGYDETTARFVRALAANATILVVTPDDDVASRFERNRTGDDDVAVLVGDPTDESTLEQADLETATAVLVATGDDAQNSYTVLAAREATDARLVVVTEDGRTDALERAGADVAIDPDALLVDAVVGATLEGENVAAEW
ncbi:NAD-binding protein [Halobacteria archaeon AArc-m2/3/4]|uniref:NAD-binding protein n=1 Tax=Natronoglomus mannanivorans TaxID=2979990 RepID=A0ABT2QDR0_9EURY|nr:NAD-binding protein [Halobacteria archaeon AArc-m2/3/4]